MKKNKLNRIIYLSSTILMIFFSTMSAEINVPPVGSPIEGEAFRMMEQVSDEPVIDEPSEEEDSSQYFQLEEESNGCCKADEQAVDEGGGEEEGGLESMINEYVELGGAIEVEAFWFKDFEDKTGSDISLEAAELDFEITVTDWAKGLLAIEYEPDDDHITVKEAFVTFGDTECIPYFLVAGRLFVPFGIGTGAIVGDTLSISDPLTIEIFETREDVIMVGRRWNGFYTGVYVFNGDTNHGGGNDHIEQYGGTIRYEYLGERTAINAGIDYISSVFDSDELSDVFEDALEARYAPGIAAHVRYFLNGFSFIAEYNGAFRSASFLYEDEDVKLAPKAWQIELGYETEILCKSTYFALNFSHSYNLHGAFPEKRFLATVGRWIYDGVLVACEYGHEEDYPTSNGGTGKTADTFIVQLAYEW